MICHKCKNDKDLSQFHKNKNNKTGYHINCKICRNEENARSRNENIYGISDPYLYQTKKKNEINSSTKICKKCNKEKDKTLFKKRDNSIDGYRKICLECYQKDQRIRERKWRKNNINYKISKYVSCRVWYSLTGQKDFRHWENIVGYTIDRLKDHLSKKFQEGMTWENYGKWHIDHIRPIASFNITGYNCEDFKKCWSLNNLQPLWAFDNKSKCDNWDGVVNK